MRENDIDFTCSDTPRLCCAPKSLPSNFALILCMIAITSAFRFKFVDVVAAAGPVQ